ncbi:magnesium transporter, partial [Vararia minispora EC-137]
MLGQILFALACMLLLHATYSTYEHVSYLKAFGRPEGPLPPDIVAEALLSLLLGILGACIRAPAAKDITWAGEMKTRTIDEMDSRLGFANFVTRGR